MVIVTLQKKVELKVTLDLVWFCFLSFLVGFSFFLFFSKKTVNYVIGFRRKQIVLATSSITSSSEKPGFTYIACSSWPSCWNVILQENSSTSRPFTGFTAKVHVFIQRDLPPWESSQMYTYNRSQIEYYIASIGSKTLLIKMHKE